MGGMIVTASVLNVRSGPGPEFRVLRQLKAGARVDIIETHGDWSWVEPAFGWVSRQYLETPRLATPRGLGQILDTFGVPGGPQASAGRFIFPAPLKLGWSSASVTRAACHAKLETTFTAVFQAIHADGLWPLLRTFDGIYNDRPSREGVKQSTHSWGIAVDLNAATNGLGVRGDMDSRVVQIFEEHGFEWGGRWRRPDGMHFQYCKDY
jgi:hypothetical protein